MYNHLVIREFYQRLSFYDTSFFKSFKTYDLGEEPLRLTFDYIIFVSIHKVIYTPRVVKSSNELVPYKIKKKEVYYNYRTSSL